MPPAASGSQIEVCPDTRVRILERADRGGLKLRGAVAVDRKQREGETLARFRSPADGGCGHVRELVERRCRGKFVRLSRQRPPEKALEQLLPKASHDAPARLVLTDTD